MHREHVVVAGFGIDPVTGSDHAVGSESGDDIVDDIARGKAKQAGLLAIDVEFQSWEIDGLWDQHVADKLGAFELQGEFARDAVTFVQIIVADLNVQRRGQTLIHN